ncbi:DUF1376 domain-containing protein [Breoghania sp. JC706]|uniref:DUF1376 domain-containing protein n=1 Tax=Breoghania sp. JC706 TaxID=3117732 RepID=UPI00300B0C8D
MSGIPYFNFYPADFMNGVRGLSPQEVGVYTMLLCRIYEENGPVDLHYLRLSTYCGMRESTFRKVLGKLVELGKLEIRGDCLTNARAELEISNRADNLKNKKRAGEISAEKRQQKQRAAPTGVEQVPNDKNTNKNNTPLNPPEGDARPKVDLDQKFEEFWQAYPKREGPNPKNPCVRKFKSAIKAGAEPDQMIQAARAYAAQMSGEPPKFVAQTQTWLNQKRWQDCTDAAQRRDAEQAVTLNGRTYTAQSIKRVVFETLTGARTWPAEKLGPEPGKPGCAIPSELVTEVRAVIAERSKPKSEIIPFQPRMIA